MQLKLFRQLSLFTFLLLIQAAANAGNGTRIITAIKLFVTINNTNGRGEIRWFTTDTKASMLRFEVQKSGDGNNFSYVTAVAGEDRNNVKQYFAEERNLLDGNNYYRLKILYYDGTVVYTPVTQIVLSAPAATVLPVVAEELLYIWLPETTRISTVSVTDISGKVIFQNAALTAVSGLANIYVKKLSPGFYNLVVQLSLTQKIHLKFYKK